MIDSEGLSRFKLMSEVYAIMAIPDKQFREWSKTSAPNAVTREGLLIDTLIAKGFRYVEHEKEPKVIPLYTLDHTKASSLHMDGTAKYVIRNLNEPGMVMYVRLSQTDAIGLNILFSSQSLGIKMVYNGDDKEGNTIK